MIQTVKNGFLITIYERMYFMERKGKKCYGLLLFFLLAGLCCFMTACSKQALTEQSTAKKDTLKKAEGKSLPKLKIGVDILEPFCYVDENGDYVGIDIAIAKKACEKAGYQPVFVEIPWDEKDAYLKNGKIDCLWGAFSIDGREDTYLWTESYLESRLGAIAERRSPTKSFKDFKGPGGIAVRAGSKVEEVLLENSNSFNPNTQKVYSCGTFSMAKTAFVKSYADALACHKVVLHQIMVENPGLYQYLEGTIMTVHLGVAFDKDAGNEKCEAINKGITEMKKDGTISQIAKKYAPDSGDIGEALDGKE